MAEFEFELIVYSQARMVATAVNSLCEAANATVQGNATQETLIASAQQVSNSTAQLLLACRVKSDPNSAGQRRLQVSAKVLRPLRTVILRYQTRISQGYGCSQV